MKKSAQEIKPNTTRFENRQKLPEFRGRKCVVERISPRFLQLLDKYPYLLDSQVDALCGNTEMNYIRSLLVSCDPAPYRRFFYEKFGVIPNTILEPVKLAYNVKFNIARQNALHLRKARRVLIKRAFGSLTGLVLSNDYAGLIIDFHALPSDEDLELKTPTANRVWAQKPISSTGAPYSLWFSHEERSQIDVGLETQLGILSREFPIEMFYEHLNEYHYLGTNLEHLLLLLEESDFNYDERYFVSSL